MMPKQNKKNKDTAKCEGEGEGAKGGLVDLMMKMQKRN